MARKLLLGIVLVMALVFMALPSEARAAEFMGSDQVLIREDQVINDDVYATGGTVTVEGTINGDLLAAAGSIDVAGVVNGDVIITGGTLVIEGKVADDVRVAGGSITINSDVGGDVLAAGGSVTIGSLGHVGEDLVIGGGSVEMRGTVDGDVKLGAGNARIDGIVLGDVTGEVQNGLTIGPNARISGDLNYSSIKDADIQAGAVVSGDIVRTIPKATIFGQEFNDSPAIRFVQHVLGRLQWFVGTVVIGLLLMLAIPETVRAVSETPRTSPWKTVGLGLAVLLVAPVVIIAVAVFALWLIGFPALSLLLAPGATYVVLALLAAPVVAVLIGNLAMSREMYFYASWKALLIGAAILAVLGLIPYLNGLVTLLTVLVGFGAWVLYLYRSYIHARLRQMV
jgi:hypothetical protein